MDERLAAVLEIEKDEQVFSFHMPYNFKFGDAYEAACEIASFLAKKSQERVDAALEQAKKAAKEAESKEKADKK